MTFVLNFLWFIFCDKTNDDLVRKGLSIGKREIFPTIAEII